ncbi:hypothetical protein H5410_022216 [Solanum commersonii]|uniref:DUF4371 domain-containing protein n=1 Tax=Solanum commersonii TaxID=4109 RepID=A0A9J5ZG56_SOLCO|nr:hypothetical protein H5410_022216 [Solanum commersonii]
MALVLRFVNKNGEVVERFIVLVHVSGTSACSLKKAIYSLLSVHSLSLSKIRGQGYDGTSNMKGDINGVKTLIMKDSPSAYYIRCFTHQFQLTLVAIAKKHLDVEHFFIIDLLRDHQAKKLEQLFESGEVQKGQGLHQERGFQRPVSSFCDVHDILIPKLDEFYFPEKSKRKSSGVSYAHQLRVEVFFVVIDVQLQELNDRFDVVSSDLLLGMGSLNPVNSFSNFDKVVIPSSPTCKEFVVLANALVEANLAETYSLVYLLVKLTLILLVATATVEGAFSSMKHIKNEVWNSIGNRYLNDYLVCYIECDVFTNVSNDVIIDRFQNMKTRRGQL